MPDLPPELIARTFKLARQFFALSDAAKQASATPDAQRGYYRYESAGGVGDVIEAFSIGREGATPAALRREYYERVGLPESMWPETVRVPTRWPTAAGPPGEGEGEGFDPALFRRTMLEYFDACATRCEPSSALCRREHITVGSLASPASSADLMTTASGANRPPQVATATTSIGLLFADCWSFTIHSFIPHR